MDQTPEPEQLQTKQEPQQPLPEKASWRHPQVAAALIGGVCVVVGAFVTGFLARGAQEPNQATEPGATTTVTMYTAAPQATVTVTAPPNSDDGTNPPAETGSYRQIHGPRGLSFPHPNYPDDLTVDFESLTVNPDGDPDSEEVDLWYSSGSGGFTSSYEIRPINGGLGKSAQRRPTAQQCADAATANPLPPLTGDAIADGSPISKGDSLCLQTVEGNIAHLFVVDVNGRDGELKSYRFSVTVWEKS